MEAGRLTMSGRRMGRAPLALLGIAGYADARSTNPRVTCPTPRISKGGGGSAAWERPMDANQSGTPMDAQRTRGAVPHQT